MIDARYELIEHLSRARRLDACLAFEPSERPSLTELAAVLAPPAPGARPWDG